MSDALSQLPPEISLRVVLELPPSALAAFQQVSPAWKEIVDANADLVFASLAGHDYSAVGAVQGLEHACEAQRQKVFERDVWQGVDSWKEFCRRRSLTDRGVDDPLCYRSRKFGTGPMMTWRLKVDLANRFLLMTDHRGGLRVLDLDSHALLWSISPFDLRPFAHLEYQPGPQATIVVDRFTDELEVWKLDETTGRGHFVLIGLVPSMPSMRGYHLKDGTLAIVTSTGQTAYYDLTTPLPTHLRTLDHPAGAIGYLDKTPSTLVLCHGSAVRCYNPLTGVELGVFPPRVGTPLQHFRVHRPTALAPPARVAQIAISDEGVKEFQELPLDVDAFDGEGGEWQACHVDGPYLVALSKKARVFVCSDYPRVLAADQGEARDAAMRETCVVYGVDRAEEEDEDADGTNWLSVHDGRAAFGAGDHLLLLPLPPTNATTYTLFPSALAHPIDRDVPPSCIQLVSDGVFFTARDGMRKCVVGVWHVGERLGRVVDLRKEGAEGEDEEVGEWEDTDEDD